MIQDLWKVAKTLVTLADDLQKYHAEIRGIREELTSLTIIVHALAQDIKNSKEQAAQKHENLLLELENRLLKFEKGLPPAMASKKSAKKSSKK